MNSKVITGCRFQIIRLIHSGSVSSNRTSPVVDSIIRVDHAGELGADRIYAGQMAVLGNSKIGPIIQQMWDQEKIHKETFEKLIIKYRARPTIMVPIWNVAGYLLGAGTALMGEKAAMACTVAVESVIVDHYNDQLRTLMAEPEKNKELLETIQKFRDEEQEHHDSGLDHGAEQAPFYTGLTEVIKFGCKTAIAISKDLFNTRKLNYSSIRLYSTSTKPQLRETQKWDLYGAVCLERKPVILKSLTPWEKNFLKMLYEMELEKSFKSDHEVRKEQDERRVTALKTEKLLTQAELDLLSKKTAQEFEDDCTIEFNNFQPATKTTEADKKKDMKSLKRQLDRSLFLIVRGLGNKWMLPSGLYQDAETMRGTAERTLRETCGNKLNAIFMGNAPCGFYKYRYPKKLNLPNIGAKVFIFKAIYHSGEISNNVEYHWVTKAELADFVESRKYCNRIKMLLLDDYD